MEKIYSCSLKVLFYLVLTFLIICNIQYCFAEESSNDSITKDAAQSNEAATAKAPDETTVDFAKGASGFHLDKAWKICDGELQLIPNEITKSRFCWNILWDRAMINYQISVNVRWISGPDNSDYGLIFGYHPDSFFYALLIALNNHVVLLKNVKGRWKSIKEVKNKTVSESYDNLKVICRDSSLQCFVNEQKIFEIKDKTLLDDSYVGLCSSGEVQCGFKDFRLEKL
ncbi:MAG TPA: hypothetical protein DDW65_03700 [Firmicutes bacterium]|jgi:hypothetical protein|nr:hypothetical protein [Bacillota bacterium]